MISLILAICILLSCVVPIGPTTLEAAAILSEFTNPEHVYEFKQNSILEIKNLDKITVPNADPEIQPAEMPEIPDKYTKIIQDASGLLRGGKLSANYNVSLKNGTSANLVLKHVDNMTYVDIDGIRQVLKMIPENDEITSMDEAFKRLSSFKYMSIRDEEANISVMDEAQENSLESMKDILSGFDNNLLEKTAENTFVYKLEVSKFPELFDKAYDALMNSEMFKEISENQEIDQNELRNSLKEVFNEAVNVFNGSFAYAEMKKIDKTLNFNIKVNIFLYGTHVISYTQTSGITDTNLTDFDTGLSGVSIVSSDIVQDYYYTALAHKYNVNTIDVSWIADGITTSEEFTVNYSGNDNEFTRESKMVNENGRIYLPLRSTCETLNETVEWDTNTNKAYVVRGDQKIDMTGKIVDGKTYVMLRDFETKLGYKLDYTNDNGIHLATLSK